MLIAEDLLLLLHDDDSDRPVGGSPSADYALAGAILIELAMRGRVGMLSSDETGGDTGETGETGGKTRGETGRDLGKNGRLVAIDDSPTGDELLDRRLAILTAKGRTVTKGKVTKNGLRPVNLVPKVAKELRAELLDRLTDKGILQADRERVLPVTRWTARDAGHGLEVRAGLESALKFGNTPSDRTGVLITLLHAQHVVPKVLTGPMGRKALRRRAAEIATENAAAEGVLGAIQTGVTAAIAVAGTNPPDAASA
ncbi:GPP34 family phosphoprotein [Kribbella sp. NBC_01245]|uniref:GOLPH3/VPS74 family protein n=1 Tax=Kribbella sp. NBC_01245 TaxID=2903578 RepID=UPI002E2D45F1|nr:GPP34 family phosphoprotein [Kribbella sp. NBC_01245]